MRGNNEPRQTPFYIAFAVAISSAIGIAFAGNLLTLFLFYEILTISTYPLVTHKGTDEAKAKGRIYLLLLMGTSMLLLLPAIIWTGVAAGTLDFAPGGILAAAGLSTGALMLLLALYIFGIGKAAVMPVHFWLPAAMVAPTPVSALLHAVAVVKAGVFTVVKVVVYVFGIDFLAASGANQWLLYVAGGTIILASLVAMTKDNLKARLAYSTVSQLAYVVAGALLATPYGILGSGLHIAMHAVGKITLFFCAGAIYTATHKTEISEMAGLGRKMPFTFIAFLIGALSIIGLPPLGGLWGKWYLAIGALDSSQLFILAALMLSFERRLPAADTAQGIFRQQTARCGPPGRHCRGTVPRHGSGSPAALPDSDRPDRSRLRAAVFLPRSALRSAEPDPAEIGCPSHDRYPKAPYIRQSEKCPAGALCALYRVRPVTGGGNLHPPPCRSPLGGAARLLFPLRICRLRDPGPSCQGTAQAADARGRLLRWVVSHPS
jgi:hypothetical protein